jgi:CHAT domain-containing protein
LPKRIPTDPLHALPKRIPTDPLKDVDLTTFQELLTAGEVFLDVYRWQSREARYAAVLTPPKGAPVLVDLGAATTLDQAIEEWRQAIDKERWAVGAAATTEQAWQRLDSLVRRPLERAMPTNTQKVWVSPDGPLARLPWNLLFATHPTTQDWLVTHIPSPRDFAVRRRTPLSPEPTPQCTLLLVGDIDFPAHWGPLPGAQSELNWVESLARRHECAVTRLTGAKASKDAVIASLAQKTYVHIPTHGVSKQPPPAVSPRSPLVGSGLVLAGGDVLTAEEMVGLDLQQVKQLTIPACGTALGEETTGQGVLGLQAALLTAGARTLLMSLWDVDDEATALLMHAFYRNLWSPEAPPPAVALQWAQAAVRQMPRFAWPVYWAGWVLVGEGW